MRATDVPIAYDPGLSRAYIKIPSNRIEELDLLIPTYFRKTTPLSKHHETV